MKIQAITLKRFEIVEENGQFVHKVISSKKVPAALTNKSLQLGKDLGILQSSTISDLLGFSDISYANKNREEAKKSVANEFDPLKFIQVIYLSVLGFNKNLNISFDEFLEEYNEPIENTMDTFGKLIDGYLSDGTNNFAKGFQNSTKKKQKRGNKKYHHQR